VLAGVTAATPYLGSVFEYNVNSVQHAYSLSVSGEGPFVFRVSPLESFTRFYEAVPDTVDLYRGDRIARSNVPVGDGIEYTDQEDGAWFWVAATLPSGANGVSETQWVATAVAPRGFVQVANFPDGASSQELTINGTPWDGSADPVPVEPGSVAITFSNSTLGDFDTAMSVEQNATTTLDVQSLLPRQVGVTGVTPSVIYVNASASITVRGSNLDLVGDVRFAGGDIVLLDVDGNRTTKPTRQSPGAFDIFVMTPDPERTKPGLRNLILELTDGGQVVVPDAVRIETRATNEGFISIRNYPGSASSQRLSLNGERWKGEDPVAVAPGRVMLEFDGGVSATFSTSVVVRANETTTVDFESLQQSQAVSIRSVSPASLFLQASGSLTILGTNLDRVQDVRIQGFRISGIRSVEKGTRLSVTRDLDQLQVSATALESARPGPRNLVLILDDGSQVTSPNALQVVEAEQELPQQQEETSRTGEFTTSSARLEEIRSTMRNDGILQDILFEYDSVALTPAAQSALERDAKFLLDLPELDIVVEGHDDEQSTREYSIAVGERRAQAVVNYLVELGVSGSQFTSVSYGEERPLCAKSTEECWQRNRRVSFTVTERVLRPAPATLD
jgi:peptidoglycan-associated lipoprotein